MQVYNKKMYHYHQPTDFDELWKVGNTIDNTSKDFINVIYNSIITNDVWHKLNGEYMPFFEVLDYFVGESLPEELSTYLLETSLTYIRDLLLERRENALEEVRKTYYPNKISRQEAIWVCDSPQLKTWQRLLNDEKELFEVEVTGDMFKTSEAALPALGMSYKESLERAHDYWNPNLDLYDESSLEYLVKGKIKVLNKVNRK